MVDRMFVGFVAIILVVTTLIAMFIFQVREDEHIRILASRTPDNVPPRKPGSLSYSIDLMAVKNIPDLVVRLHFLANTSTMPLVKPWNETTARELEDLVSNVPGLAEIKAQLGNAATAMGVESLVQEYEIERADRKLLIVDLTEAIKAFIGKEPRRTVYTLYAFNIDPAGGVSFFRGYRDFFLYPVQEIKYSTQTESLCFRSESVPGGLGTCGPLIKAPTADLRFGDLSAGERVHLEVTLSTMGMFAHRGLLQIVTTETGHRQGPDIVEWMGAAET
jgi:hypothetical protein